MTARLTFEKEHGYFGDTIHLNLRVLRPSRGSFSSRAILDTGASISVFNRSIFVGLGLKLQDGRKTSVRVADGRRADAFVFDVHVELLGMQLTIPVCFCPEWPSDTRNLLGMEGFLDQLTIALDHANRRLYVNRRP